MAGAFDGAAPEPRLNQPGISSGLERQRPTTLLRASACRLGRRRRRCKRGRTLGSPTRSGRTPTRVKADRSCSARSAGRSRCRSCSTCSARRSPTPSAGRLLAGARRASPTRRSATTLLATFPKLRRRAAAAGARHRCSRGRPRRWRFLQQVDARQARPEGDLRSTSCRPRARLQGRDDRRSSSRSTSARSGRRPPGEKQARIAWLGRELGRERPATPRTARCCSRSTAPRATRSSARAARSART